jgi:hypothetical protein
MSSKTKPATPQPITDTEEHMSKQGIPVQIEQGMVIRPGDTLILRVPLYTTPELVHKTKERAAEVLSDVNLVVIAAEQMAIYRPNDTTNPMNPCVPTS